MALNSISERQLREHWERAQPITQAYAQYAARHGHQIGFAGALVGVLQMLQTGLELTANSELNSTQSGQILQEKAQEIKDAPLRIERQFRRLLSRQINSGRKVPIGLKHYRGDRREFRLVWDGAIRSAKFDLGSGDYCGPNFKFFGVRILDRSDCGRDLLKKWDRVRKGKQGRPRLASTVTAIERAFLRESDLDNPKFLKRAAEKVVQEIARMRKSGETEENPSERTIQSALRKRWRNIKSDSPTR